MPKRTASERIQRAVEECRPLSDTGAMFVDRYLRGVDLTRSISSADREVWNVREICRIVEQHTFEPLTFDTLQAAIDAGPTKTARQRRRVVLSRLDNLLQDDGLPTRAERRASARIERTLERLSKASRLNMERWVAHRRDAHVVGWHELSYETPRLARLELLAATSDPRGEEPELLARWLHQEVRQVVACSCPPVTRRRDPLRCMACGATPSAHGTRPSPGPRKQRELLILGRHYLSTRPLTTERNMS